MFPIVELTDIYMDFNIGKKYFHASSGVSMSIKEKEIITIVGESGCGKSTIGKICLGVQKLLKAMFYITVKIYGTEISDGLKN